MPARVDRLYANSCALIDGVIISCCIHALADTCLNHMPLLRNPQKISVPRWQLFLSYLQSFTAPKARGNISIISFISPSCCGVCCDISQTDFQQNPQVIKLQKKKTHISAQIIK